MAHLPPFENSLRDQRVGRGWSQEELAKAAGLSRAGVSAIETDRLVPSAAAALALAAALECRVEDLFRLKVAEKSKPVWAWPPRRDRCRYWAALVRGVVRRYPAEATPLGVVPHDGIDLDESAQGDGGDPRNTLVIACCDPAVGVLAAELAQTAGVRLLALERPSRAALALLGQGLVHIAGVHLSGADNRAGNAAVVKNALGAGFSLLRVARWEEGIVFAPGRSLPSVRAAARSDLRWIARETGSGARQCLDEILGSRRAGSLCLASDHRGVAQAVRNGWADAGVCVRLVSDEAGLDFLGVRQEAYDLCFPAESQADPRVQALLHAVRSNSFRRTVGELPGYDSTETGELQHIKS